MDKAEINQIEQSQQHLPLKVALLKTVTQRLFLLLLATVVLLSSAISVLDSRIAESKYQLNSQSKNIVGSSVYDLAKAVTRDPQNGDYVYKKDLQTAQPQANQSSNTEGQYSVTVKNDPKQGISYYDPASKQTLTIKPQFDLLQPRQVDNRIVIPAQGSTTQEVLTFKGNGVKEDLVLPTPQGNTKEFSYKLELPASLEARLLENGEVGIYTGSDSTLFGQISYGSDKDRQMVEKAQAKAKKDKLVFLLPTPVIKQAGGSDLPTETSAKFSFKNKMLTVTATNIARLKYPISIDPTTIINSTTTIDRGNNEGNAVYGSGTAQIKRAAINGGDITSWTSANMSTALSGMGVVAFNNNLYVLGGCTALDATPRCSTTTTAVIKNPINQTTGALGSWSSANSALPVGWYNFQAAVYNGYIYVSGGLLAGSNPSVNNSVYYAKIKTDASGDLESWNLSPNGFLTPRTNHALVATNGYLYAMGGCIAVNSWTSSGAPGCNGGAGTTLASAESVPLKADGSLGVWAASGTVTSCNTYCVINLQSTAFVYNRNIVLNIVMDISGTIYTYDSSTYPYSMVDGTISSGKNLLPISISFPIQSAYIGYAYSSSSSYALNSDSISSYSSRALSASGCASSGVQASYKDHAYCVGKAAFSGSMTPSTAVQYAGFGNVGSLGNQAVATNVISPSSEARFNPCGVVYGGYGYVLGGDGPATTYLNTVFAGKLTAEGGVGTWVSQNTFSTGRTFLTCQVYNGYIYIIGGYDGVGLTDLADIQYAKITAGGTLGTWQTATAKLPAGRAGLASAVYKNADGNVYLYSIGGCTTAAGTCGTTSTPKQEIYYTKLDQSTGSTAGNACGWTGSAWDCASAPGTVNAKTASRNTNLALYSTLMNHSALTYKGKLYVVGGQTAAANTSRTNSVRYVDITAPGGDITAASGDNTGSWFSTSSLGSLRAFTSVAIWNGIMYALGGVGGAIGGAGTTGLSTTEYATISSNGDLSAWTPGSALPTTYQRNAVGVQNGYLFLMSGSVNGSRSRNILSIEVHNGGRGANAATTATTRLTKARDGHSVAAYNGYLYVAGGEICPDTDDPCTGTGSLSLTNTVQRAAIGSDGELGSWTSETNVLTTNRFQSKLVIYNNYAYIMGGCSSTDCSSLLATTERASINPSDGSLGTWTTAGTSAFTTGRFRFQSLQYKGFIYILGGCSVRNPFTNGCTTDLNDTQYAAINSDGTLGSWALSTTFNLSRSTHFATTYNGYIYIGGGTSTTATLYDVQYALINSDGTLGSWTTDQYILDKCNSSTEFAASQAFAENGYLHITYGYTGELLSAPIGSSGALIGAWNTSSNIITAQAATSSFGGVVYYNGYAYFIGGFNAFVQLLPGVYKASMYTIPHIATYSKLINTDVDTNPTKITFSGTNTNNPSYAGTEGLGGVNIRYKSVTNGGTTGVSTLINPGLNSIFGNLFGYTAYDSSGVDRGLAQGYLLTFTIDGSQTGVFPDSSSNFSTVTGYNFWYHAGSGKRLRGGKTFTSDETNIDLVPSPGNRPLDTTPN